MINDIYSIWLREMRKALADKLTLIVGTVMPIAIILLIGAGVDSFVDVNIPNLSYTGFLGPGIIALWAMASGSGIGNSIIEDKAGFLKALLVAPVSRASIFIGKIIGDMTLALGITFLTAILFLAYTDKLTPARTLMSLLFIILIAFGFNGLGLLMGLLFKKAKGYQIMTGVVSTALIFLSGIFFPAKNLPAWMKTLVMVNPLTYGVDALRIVMVGYGDFGILIDLIVLLTFSSAMVMLGSLALRSISTR